MLSAELVKRMTWQELETVDQNWGLENVYEVYDTSALDDGIYCVKRNGAQKIANDWNDFFYQLEWEYTFTLSVEDYIEYDKIFGMTGIEAAACRNYAKHKIKFKCMSWSQHVMDFIDYFDRGFIIL